MAGEGKNLLTRTLATAADEQMQMYVVYNGRDYRVLLGTLLSLITKAKLGLENVSNTSDADKPLSTAMQAALAGKVDVGNTVTREEWNLFIQQFSGMVSAEELNTIIASLQTALASKADLQDVQNMVDIAIQPMNTALQQLTLQVNQLSGSMSQYALKTDVNSAIGFVTSTIASLNQAFTDYTASNDARVLALESRVTILEENSIILGPNFW